ncbi:MAG: hypothetical protein ABSH08_12330, partial [Tepidisphaeraceae bacterium]
RKLALKSPEFHLEKEGDRIFGDIISPSFKRKTDHKRQELIWDALESELGAESLQLVGMLLAFTPEEWNLGDDILSAIQKNKKRPVENPVVGQVENDRLSHAPYPKSALSNMRGSSTVLQRSAKSLKSGR